MSDENNYGLNEAELRVAAGCGMTPGDYAFWKSRPNVQDVEARRAQQAGAAEHDRLKAAIREALDEREKG